MAAADHWSICSSAATAAGRTAQLPDSPESNRRAVRDARAIVAQEADEFLAWSRGVQAGPTISALRQRAEVVRQAELDRLKAKLSGLDDAQRDAVDALTKGILNTLLHEPTVRLKGLVDSPDGERFVRALSHLFDLAPEGGVESAPRGDVDRADRNG